MSNKKNIAVIIRVFSRISDALGLIHIIQNNWETHNYTIFVSHNGRESGYIFPENSLNNITLIEVAQNSGHRNGAKDLLLASFDYITSQFDYALFIEADFWALDETLILETLEQDCDVATTIWIESRKSMAVDFFIVKQEYLAKNRTLLAWENCHSPELSFAIYLINSHAKIYLLQRMRPTHSPKLMRKFLSLLPIGNSYVGGRFRLFPKAKVLTHHVEDLPNGIDTKKQLANSLMQRSIFSDSPKLNSVHKTLGFFEKNIQYIGKYFPQSSWLKKHYWRNLKSDSFYK